MVLALQILFWTFLILCCTYAIVRGGPPERAGAIMMAVASVLSVVALTPYSVRWLDVERGAFAVDLALLAALLALALLSTRFWPIWSAGFHLVGVATPIVFALFPEPPYHAYSVAQGLWAYPALIAMVIGTRNHRKAMRTGRTHAFWRQSSAPHG